MQILVKGLTHVYGKGTSFEHKVLNHIHLAIPSGRFVCIVGHTGSGKSTLIQHFNGLLRPTAGEVSVGEFVITSEKQDLRRLRQKVGMTFQYPEYQLFEETVEKDIAFGPRQLGWPEDLIEERVQKAMQMVGLDVSYAKRLPFSLSGGQKRRVALAGVLATDPQLLILDEPTAGLDPRGKKEILSLIKQLHQEHLLTVIMVTHDMEEAAQLAQQLVVMQRGEVLLNGTPAEVFAHSPGELKESGLEWPEATRLIHQLNLRLGLQLPAHLFTLDEVENALVALLDRANQP